MQRNPSPWFGAGVFTRTLTALACLGLTALTAGAATTRYVWPDSPNPMPPFTDWTTAARVIQDAVDAAQVGDLVRITNGTYATGGRAVAAYPLMTNRVAMEKPLRLESVNGPQVTIIQGAKAPGGGNGDGAFRCAYLADGVTLSGFTLTGGATRAGGDWQERSGGGAWCTSTNAVLTNCVLTGNSAESISGGAFRGTLYNCTLTGNSAGDGGGASGGTLYNCTLTGNSAGYGGGASSSTLYNCVLTGNSACDGGGACDSTLSNCTLTGNSATGEFLGGGGAYGSTLYNCTLTGNSAFEGGGARESTLYNCTLTGNSADWYGGGVYVSTLSNCIVYFNTAPNGANYSGSTIAYSCTAPLPPGSGNIDADPLLASVTHLSAQSPCIGRGSPQYASGVDLDGEPWLNPPCMGADQFVAGTATGPLTVAITANYPKVATGFVVSFVGQLDGRLTGSVWDFGDGVVASNRPYASHAWAEPGIYSVRLTGYNDTHPEGVTATVEVTVTKAVAHVNAASDNPVFPYANWATAATNIQDAIGAAILPGHLVLVTNGTYGVGTVVGYGLNRVVLTSRVVVRSVNGPEVTVIEGSRKGPGTGEGVDVRCAYVEDGSVLSGFTLTDGYAGDGGGAWCEWSGVLTNCTLTGNSAYRGGGASGGTLYDCTLTGNLADVGGGVSDSTLSNCTLTGNSAIFGGGACRGTLYNCVLTGNSAVFGGGVYGGTLTNCTLTGNSAENQGGGAAGETLYNCTLFNCTLTGNSAGGSGGGVSGSTLFNCTLAGNSADVGGGVSDSTLSNCIVYFNQADYGPNWAEDWGGNAPKFAYSCTTPLPPGPGNLAADPLFVNAAAGDFRLRPDSPCSNAGSNEFVFGNTDLAGNPRIIGGKVDMGAFEFDPAAPLVLLNSVTLTAEGLRIEWPATAVGATLQRSATLNPPAWQDVPGSESATTVTMPVTQAQEFFRLVKR